MRAPERLGQATDHDLGLLQRGFVDPYRLEATLERRVFLEVFLELSVGRGRNGAELAPRQGGLQQIGCVATALRTTCADQRVSFVDEEDDGLFRRFHGVDHALEAVLELTAHAGTGLQRSQIERQHAAVGQHLGYGPSAMRRPSLRPAPFCRRWAHPR